MLTYKLLVHQDLDSRLPSYVIDDVFVMVETIANKQCKGNTLECFPFCP
jgi:hypothetical protein